MTRATLLLLAWSILCGVAGAQPAPAGQSVKLPATADIWLSSMPKEEDSSAGKYPSFKLKSIQEMAAIRFDLAPAAGREILQARLMLRPSGGGQPAHMLRYVRVSTINADWVEGEVNKRIGAEDDPGQAGGATYTHADHGGKRPWSFAGSQFCDVIMGSGNSLDMWTQVRQLEDGWVAIELTPPIMAALLAGDSDGLAVMDGGTPAFFNNLIDSVQSKNPPYIQAELGKELKASPPTPVVKAQPAPEMAHAQAGALQLVIEPDKQAVACYRLKLDGKPVQRWRVKHPQPGKPTAFYLEDLAPSAKAELEIVAVAPGGAASEPARLSVESSAALASPPELPTPATASAAASTNLPTIEGKMRVRVCPALVKISPERPEPMHNDIGGQAGSATDKTAWGSPTVNLSGARGEYVSFQIVIENLGCQPLSGVTLDITPLRNAGTRLEPGDIELYRLWYAQNRDGKWQGAYAVPLAADGKLDIPDPQRKLPTQQNQSVYVDIYIPKKATPGVLRGQWAVRLGDERLILPIRVNVLNFELPDKLCFWPQLNSLSMPAKWQEYFKLAHQHRCVWYYRSLNCRTDGAGKDLKVVWDDYDKLVEPVLSGEAFKGNRRAGVPVEAFALPFWDSWPTPLTKETYKYDGPWPGRGDDPKLLVEHYMKAPYIADGLSQGYKDAFLTAQRQFIEHFAAKGWNKTEMQCVFVGKNTHRTNFGINMWWTTDEPYHWDDWLALQFFDRLWRSGLDAAAKADAKLERALWTARADISRPMWQGRVLDEAIDCAYFGGMGSPLSVRRCQKLAQEVPLSLRVYGSASADSASYSSSLAWIVGSYLNGAGAALPWQSMGSDRSLDVQDGGGGNGNALIAPGDRFGVPVVADIRLKAFRDGQQICEYLKLVQDRYGLNREQLRVLVGRIVRIGGAAQAGASADNANALVFGALTDGQIQQLRQVLAELFMKQK